jgi:hypothetical protein
VLNPSSCFPIGKARQLELLHSSSTDQIQASNLLFLTTRPSNSSIAASPLTAPYFFFRTAQHHATTSLDPTLVLPHGTNTTEEVGFAVGRVSSAAAVNQRVGSSPVSTGSSLPAVVTPRSKCETDARRFPTQRRPSAMFTCLHQSAVFFSQNKPATSN